MMGINILGSILKTGRKEKRGAADFLYDLLEDSDMRARFMDIALLLPERRRGDALRSLGYDFTSGELERALSKTLYETLPAGRAASDRENLRDFLMREWGNHM
ncbi:MAG: hypothetical protein Q4D58_04760 [Synergistaceae bacterium]|nr:hypothetical protein [Synergistaceae bacterium]